MRSIVPQCGASRRNFDRGDGRDGDEHPKKNFEPFHLDTSFA